jgi:hypothetical protein
MCFRGNGPRRNGPRGNVPNPFFYDTLVVKSKNHGKTKPENYYHPSPIVPMLFVQVYLFFSFFQILVTAAILILGELYNFNLFTLNTFTSFTFNFPIILAAACGMPIGYSAVILPQLHNESDPLNLDLEMSSWIGKCYTGLVMKWVPPFQAFS